MSATIVLPGYTACTSYSPIQSPRTSHLGTAPRAAFSQQISQQHGSQQNHIKVTGTSGLPRQLSSTRDHCPRLLLDSQLPHTSH